MMSAHLDDDAIRHATTAQRSAADPSANVFVSANAGSGKTRVLVERVLRLLLAGAEPPSLVCVTYTKAAAAEMRARVFAALGRWAVAGDDALDAELTRLTGATAITSSERDRARGLFTAVLETPGGLRIQTIHAFCERILRRFPIEAGAPPGFDVMEEAAAEACSARAAAHVARRVFHQPEGALAKAFAWLADMGEPHKGALRRFVLRHRQRLSANISAAGSVEAASARLRAELGLAADDTPDSVRAHAVAALDRSALQRAAHVLAAGGKTDQQRAAHLNEALTTADPAMAFRACAAAFLTQKGVRTSRPLMTKTLADDNPVLLNALGAAADVIDAAQARARAAHTAALSHAALVYAEALIAAYAEDKRRHGALDFDDLIALASALFTSAAAPWVLYKLDGGLAHILVDEAQDTSPEQWDLVHALTEEFLAGQGAREEEGPRTLFAVGDEKQSIYGFQGAEPARFLEAAQRLSRQNAERYRGVALPVSFRSAPAILQVVDAVFGETPVAGRLTPQGDIPRHRAARTNAPGRVELWPLAPTPDRREAGDPWSGEGAEDDGAHPEQGDDAETRLAKTLAAYIADEPSLRPGDIMILVRRRGPVFERIIAALKAAGVPVAGADRMVLREQTAVQDLLSAARVALLPEDDLVVAEFLKTPFVHPVGQPEPPIDETALFGLAHGREGRLWRALMQSEDGRLAEARDLVRDLLARVAVETPHAFFAGLLDRASATGESYAARLYHRLGAQAEDPVRELLDRAAAHGAVAAPSLERFVAETLNDAATIKRELGAAGNAVRVMTVHGAKGLEAPTVILADAGVAADVQFPTKDDGLRLTANADVLVSPRKDDDPPMVSVLRELARDDSVNEDLRLLYVAMTRAEERLIVCGAAARGRGGETSWCARVRTGLETLGAAPVLTPIATGDDEPGLAWGAPSSSFAPTSVQTDGADTIVVPAWARERWQSPNQPSTPARIAPSKIAHGGVRAIDDEVATSPLATPAPDRYRRGVLLHTLLEHLPDLPSGERGEAGVRWLMSQGVTREAAQNLTHEATTIFDDPAFAAVFAPGSRAECAVSGPVVMPGGEEVVVEGRVDRLVVTEHDVLIVDYKSDQRPPASVDAVSEGYRAQLAAYRAVLKGLYPGRKIRCALLWTVTPALMEIPQS